MSRDVRELLEQAAPEPTRGLDAEGLVGQAVRQRRLGLAAAAVLILVIAAGVVGLVAGLLPGDEPLFIDPTDQEQALHLQFRTDPLSPAEVPDMDEVATLLASDPAVTDVRVRTSGEVADRMRKFADDFGEENLPLVVDVTVTAIEPIRDVAIRLRQLVGGQVRRGHFDEAIIYVIGVGPDVDPEPAVSPVVEVATFDVAGETLTLDVWQIEDGGICYRVGIDVWCDADALLTGHGFGARVLSTPSPEVTCLWGAVAVDAEEVTLRFTEGETTAVIGDAPDLMLSRGFIGCVEGDVMPVEGEARGPGGSSGWGSDPDSWSGEWPRPVRDDGNDVP